MKHMTKVGIAAVALAAAATGAIATPAYAWVSVGMKTQYPAEGGRWDYGFWDAKLRSYYTVNRCHGSTVVKYINGGEVARSRSIDTASGVKSIAEISTLNSSGLESRHYYRTC